MGINDTDEVVMNNRLPISHYEPDGRGFYYDYWINYCEGQPAYFLHSHVIALATEWGAEFHGVIGRDDPPYIEFQDPKMLTLFLLRYS